MQGKEIEEWVKLTEQTFNFACYASAWFRNGDMDTKRAIFGALGAHLILKDRKIAIELHPYFKTIAEKRDIVENEIEEVITSEKVDMTVPLVIFRTKCPVLRGRPDSNRRSGP